MQNQHIIIQAVIRACEILECLAEQPNGLGISDLAQRLDLGKAIVFNTLQTLMVKGFVEQEPVTAVYRLGANALKLSSVSAGRLNLRYEALPHLQRLRDTFQETTYLAILRGEVIVYMERCDSPRQLRTHAFIGETAPLHCTALGKAILARLPLERAQAVIELAGMPAFTPRTITTLPALLEELARIKERGYATDEMEHDEDIRCIAAPVVSLRDEIYAAISVSGPGFRLRAENDAVLAAAVMEAALQISERFVY